jgi:hypothetical protein
MRDLYLQADTHRHVAGTSVVAGCPGGQQVTIMALATSPRLASRAPRSPARAWRVDGQAPGGIWSTFERCLGYYGPVLLAPLVQD